MRCLGDSCWCAVVSTCFVDVKKRPRKRTSEHANERTCTNERAKERVRERTNKRSSKSIGRKDERRSNARANDANERTNKRPNAEQKHARTNEHKPRKSSPNRCWDAPGARPGGPKSTKNREKSLLARSWGDRGARLGDLGALWGDLGAFWGDFGALLGDFGPPLGDLGALLEPPGRSRGVSESARDEFVARAMRKSSTKGLQSEFRATLR